ncbi:MAG: hypothetical protein IAC08_04765 [Bacteroidetes bacterium]|uniref:Uncharacterized protein n=1 Tax=Candidatus Cryptobacteroides intestinigallinarum TaxID=2840767 RepID=A0A9D9HKU5_9BACT|nr:hypothetical protein [Candidatus Cryptobacteroides intestinigallinarum]
MSARTSISSLTRNPPCRLCLDRARRRKVVGGAIAPVVMGLIGEQHMTTGFLIPLDCFAVILAYAALYRRMRGRLG